MTLHPPPLQWRRWDDHHWTAVAEGVVVGAVIKPPLEDVWVWETHGRLSERGVRPTANWAKAALTRVWKARGWKTASWL
jgi:hypothetical protein